MTGPSPAQGPARSVVHLPGFHVPLVSWASTRRHAPCCLQLGDLPALGPKTGLHVLADVLQKAATRRPGNSPHPPVPEAPWRIAAPATTGTPSSACDERCISCTRVAHHRTWVPATTRDWAARPRPPPCSGDPRALATLAKKSLGPAIDSPRPSAGGSPMPVPGSPRDPVPRRVFSKLALSTVPPSPRERFVVGGPSQHWNQCSPPSACWRLLAAARLPRHCRLNSPSVHACDTSLSLYTSYTPATACQKRCPAGGPFERPPFSL